jgi:hypothetical protein
MAYLPGNTKAIRIAVPPKGAAMAGYGPSLHSPQCSIIPAFEALSVKTIDQS